MSVETGDNLDIFTVGLTGGIASGKSSATQVFESLGIPVVDADLIAREVVTAGSPALQQLSQLFNESILTDAGDLDRQTLRGIIFAEPAMRKKVEAVLHPAIRQRSRDRVQQYADSGAPYVVCAIPLLVETGQTGFYDRIVVVDVPVETQVRRLMARDNSSREDAIKILDSQASRDDRLSVADDVIENTGSLEELTLRVTELHQCYLNAAST